MNKLSIDVTSCYSCPISQGKIKELLENSESAIDAANDFKEFLADCHKSCEGTTERNSPVKRSKKMNTVFFSIYDDIYDTAYDNGCRSSALLLTDDVDWGIADQTTYKERIPNAYDVIDYDDDRLFAFFSQMFNTEINRVIILSNAKIYKVRCNRPNAVELKGSEPAIATFKYLEEHYPNPRLEAQREEYSRIMRIVQEDIGRIIDGS